MFTTSKASTSSMPARLYDQAFPVSYSRTEPYSILYKNFILLFNASDDSSKKNLSFNLDTREWQPIVSKESSLIEERLPCKVCHFGQDKILRFGWSKPKPLQNTPNVVQRDDYRENNRGYVFSGRRDYEGSNCSTYCEVLTFNERHNSSQTTKDISESTQLQVEFEEVKINDCKIYVHMGSTLDSVQNKLYLFGGVDGNNHISPALSIINTVTRDNRSVITDHTQSVPGSKEGNPMKRRSGQVSAVYGESIYYYGGMDENGMLLYDMWNFNLKSLEWNEIKFKGLMSLPRANGLSCHAGDTIFFSSGEQKGLFNPIAGDQSLVSYNINTKQWEIPNINVNFNTNRNNNERIFEIYQNMLVYGEAYNISFTDSGLKNFPGRSDDSSFKASDQLLFREKLYPDVTFNVGGQHIPAHKAILATRCEYFDELFQGKAEDVVIDIPQMTPNLFNGLLEYIYCGNVENLTEDVATELIKLSGKYGVSGLRDFCEKFLINTLEAENAIEITNLADSCEASNLLEAGLLFIAENFATVCKQYDIKKLSSSALFQLFRKKLQK